MPGVHCATRVPVQLEGGRVQSAPLQHKLGLFVVLQVSPAAQLPIESHKQPFVPAIQGGFGFG
jgi:hypothetical protein